MDEYVGGTNVCSMILTAFGKRGSNCVTTWIHSLEVVRGLVIMSVQCKTLMISVPCLPCQRCSVDDHAQIK